ncbi:MAG: alpha/beta hydrolase [Hamadaea sp.]|uniref:alpha/beta fold hydrolase n=1 Tax=Hamadaea sp. TaxID=2024425 RepID=UPI00181E8520|nr:alpha/beta hydrolase [Hamadaea sp.]NUR74113.1 alpha/beta hydrolase [Hamadaea sp.]NUT19980.1 alpha/beta hydrolase [Hamadaea sp.]
MTAFVLVPGAWLGAWAWDDVAAELRTAGHDVYAVTLSGLADRQGQPAAQHVHVQDVVDVVEKADLRDVVLAGHSYSGVPVGQAAQRIGDRLRRVVFVDSNIPVDGRSFAEGWSEDGQKWLREAMAESGGYWPPLRAEDYAGHDMTEEQVAYVVGRSTPHPGAAVTEPARLIGSLGELPATYIKCLMDGPEPSAEVKVLLESPSWRLVTMNTGHWPMFSQPVELARILLAEAGGS